MHRHGLANGQRWADDMASADDLDELRRVFGGDRGLL